MVHVHGTIDVIVWDPVFAFVCVYGNERAEKDYASNLQHITLVTSSSYDCIR